MNKRKLEILVSRYVNKVEKEAENYEQRHNGDRDEESYLIEATILEVNPSETLDSVEQAEFLFEYSDYTELDIPRNWTNYPNDPQEPLRETLEVVVDRVMRLEVLDVLGIDHPN